MKQIRNLPSGWSRAKIGDVRSKTEQVDPKGRGKFVYIDIGSVDRGRKVIYNPQVVYGSNAPSRARKLVKSGDTLVSLTRPNLNSVCLVGEEYDGQIASTGFDVLRLDGFDARWIYYIVRTKGFVDKMSGLVQGALYPAIRSADVDSFEIPVAPVNEQRRIADKLDRVLARVDAANEHLSRVGPLLKKFRSAVLEAAISGWLVDNEFELDGFDEVRASELRSFRGADLPLLPESWAWLPFGSVAQVVSDLRDPSGYGDFIHLAPNNIEPWTGVVSGCRTIAEDGVFSPKHVFRAGQIVYSKIRPNLCKVAIPEFSGLCSADMYPIETRLDERYLLLYMLSDRFTGWASNSDSRTVLPKINKKDLYSIPVPVPLSLSEQKAITSKVHVLLSIEREVTGALQVAKSQVDELIPSLLAKAFRGELAPQNPDDEPSSELLARLAEAKASENHSPTRRKRQASV